MEAIKNAVFGTYNQHQDTTKDSTQNNNNNDNDNNNNNYTAPESYKQEPISGVQGDTSKGEPFDAGNMDPQPTSASASNLHNNMETATSDSHLGPPSNTATTPASTSIPGPTGESNLVAHKEPATNMQTDPSSTKDVTRDHDPTTNDNDDNDEPQPDISGPGPRPISQVAREHGGHMPESKSSSSSSSSSSSPNSSPSRRDGDSKKSGGEQSSGDKYMSSGFAATGGNFDAAHPGAGQEALRLMHVPGQHKTAEEVEEEKKHHHHPHKPHLPGHNGQKHSGEHAQPQSTKDGDVQTADHSGSGKASLGEKIKNKLHIRSKDKESASTTA